jgi:hypothetical protein
VVAVLADDSRYRRCNGAAPGPRAARVIVAPCGTAATPQSAAWFETQGA